MPNTTDDKNLEYITIHNTSPGTQSLSWFILSDKKKGFIFSSDIFLEAWEKKQFFRPETKLVLNNTNEKLTLKNPAWEIVSEVEYTSSTKWNFLSFEINETWNEGSTISDEVWISWEALISDELDTTSPDSEETEWNSSSWSESTPPQGLKVPDVNFWLQRPSYISQSGSLDVYLCDKSKDECKVNFDLWPSFSDEFPERDYVCKIDFWFGAITDQENKCNPNTVIFPEWEHEVIFQIFHEDDASVFSEKNIKILNPVKSQIAKSSEVASSKTSSSSGKNYVAPVSSKNKIYISPPQIIVQSGLSGEGRYFYCKKRECRMNLKYEKIHKNERCLWDFWKGIQSSKTTHKKCNPWYVSLSEWIHDISLRVYEKNNPINKKQVYFYVYNTDSAEEKEEKKPQVFKVYSEWEKEYTQKWEGNIQAKIILQWKETKTQIRWPKWVACQWVEKCYLNFTASGVINSKNYSYTWLKNGKIFSEKYNPAGEWFESWKYAIRLQVFRGDELLKEVLYQVLVSEKSLTKTQPSVGSKMKPKKKKKIKKEFTQNFLALKYDGLRISGKAPLESKVEVFLGKQKIWSSRVNSKWKYRIVTKNIKAGNYIFSTKITFTNGEEKIYENSWEYTLLQEKRVFWFISKKSRKKSRKTWSKKVKIPQLVMQAQASDMQQNKNAAPELSLKEKIAAYFFLALALLLALGHMFLRQIDSACKSSKLLSHSLRFSVKQQVNLLLG